MHKQSVSCVSKRTSVQGGEEYFTSMSVEWSEFEVWDHTRLFMM